MIKLVDWDSPLWDEYESAYGDVKEVLQVLMGEDEMEYELAFEEVCENIHHQLTFYPAMYLVIPYFLKRLDETQDIGYQVDIIIEVGLVMTLENRWEHEPVDAEVMESYLESIERIKEITKKLVKNNLEVIKGRGKYVAKALCAAMLALFGDLNDAYLLFKFSWNNSPILCECCGFYKHESILSEEETRAKITPADSVLGQWDGESYDKLYVWFSNLVDQLELEEEKEILSYCYGTFTCPQCGNTRHLMHFIKSYYFGVEGGSYRMDWGE